MQAQFYPPERPSNSSHPPHRPSDRRGPSLPPRNHGNRNRVSSDVRVAASGGDFRAIATILNSVLTPHDISAWVGEAGPGYLQVTLTVKRPPARQPLIRLVSHQLYSLQSDVILGANLTVQVAQTNLILWNQLVRLPLPEIYKQPSKWDIWHDQLTEWKTQAGTKVLDTLALSQRTLKAWYEKGRTNLAQSPTSEDLNPSDLAAAVPHTVTQPSQASGIPQEVGVEFVPASNDSDPESTDHSSTVVPKGASAVPPEILKQAQQHAQQVAKAQQQQQAQSNLNGPNGSAPLDEQQWSAMSMVPGVVMIPSPSSTASVSVSGIGNSLGLEATANVTSEHERSAIAGGGSGGGFGGGFGTLRAKVVHQMMNPSPWTLGGAAIAAFLVGSTLVDSISTTVDSQDNRSVPTEQALPHSTGVLPDPTQGTGGQESDIDGANVSDTLANSSATASLDSTNPVITPSRSTNRPKTVEMHDQTIEVVPLMPTVANRSEVTLTFSGSAIVPLPPPEPEKPTGWRSLFSSPAASPPSHPADIAMAMLNHPMGQSTANGEPILTPQTLHQGGIDVVNIAGNNVAKSQDPSLRDTVRLLSQSAIRTVGAGLTEKKASRPQIFDIKGHRIAVLGYVDTHLYAADQDMAGNNPGSRRRLEADIDAIRDQVDWVIVSYHWNDVDTAHPTDQQIRLAHLAVDQGADLVVGYHPNVLQGGEIYNGRAIAYSLGQTPSTLSQTNAALSPYNSASLPETASTGASEGSTDNTPADNVPANDNILDSVPHQLPNSGIRTSPSNTDEVSDAVLNVDAANRTMATMLKVVFSDRHMGVEFIPVQTRSGMSEFAQGRDGQAVLGQLKAALRAFEDPLSLNGMAHLPLSPNIRAFSNSAEEAFQPDSADGFIERTE